MLTLEIITDRAKKTCISPMDFIQTIMPGMSLNLYYLIYYLISIPSNPVVQTPSSFLPITPSSSYTLIQHRSQSGSHQSNRYSPSAYSESQSLMPDSDYRQDDHIFAEDLSPLAIDNCQLLPGFKDVIGNDPSPASPTDRYPATIAKEEDNKSRGYQIGTEYSSGRRPDPNITIVASSGPRYF